MLNPNGTIQFWELYGEHVKVNILRVEQAYKLMDVIESLN